MVRTLKVEITRREKSGPGAYRHINSFRFNRPRRFKMDNASGFRCQPKPGQEEHEGFQVRVGVRALPSPIGRKTAACATPREW